MTEVVSIKFSNRGKVYYFDPNGLNINPGDTVILETSKGLDIAQCWAGNHLTADDSVVAPLRPVVRIATEEDIRTAETNKAREKEAMEICRQKISEHQLDMKLVDVECGFEGNKIMFFFTSDGRVDFRELVKDLAAIFRTRIELRQIGVRDETKLLGGLGICGRPYCCNQFLNDFEPVSTKMAKTQSMSLNPAKISGSCGRLMCCLRYEQAAYEDLVKTIPKNGAFVQTVGGYGSVVQTNVLRQKIKVRIDGEGDQEIKTFDAAQVASVPGGRPKPGDPLPQVLNYVPQPKEDEEAEQPEDPWKAPTLFADHQETAREQAAERPQAQPQQPARADGHRRPKNRGGRPQQKHGENKGAEKHEGGVKPQQGSSQKADSHEVRRNQAPKPHSENSENSAEKKSSSVNRNRRYHSGKQKNGSQPRPKNNSEQSSKQKQ